MGMFFSVALVTSLGPGCFVYMLGDCEVALERLSVIETLRTDGVYVQLKQWLSCSR